MWTDDGDCTSEWGLPGGERAMEVGPGLSPSVLPLPPPPDVSHPQTGQCSSPTAAILVRAGL